MLAHNTKRVASLGLRYQPLPPGQEELAAALQPAVAGASREVRAAGSDCHAATAGSGDPARAGYTGARAPSGVDVIVIDRAGASDGERAKRNVLDKVHGCPCNSVREDTKAGSTWQSQSALELTEFRLLMSQPHGKPGQVRIAANFPRIVCSRPYRGPGDAIFGLATQVLLDLAFGCSSVVS